MSNTPLRIFAISLGCPKNRVDTEHALGFHETIHVVDTPEEADWLFINTCGFIAPAVEESVQTIIEYVNFKEEADKRPKLIVAGCLVGRYGERSLSPDLPEVDLFLDAKTVDNWRSSLMDLYTAGRSAATAFSTAEKKQPDKPTPNSHEPVHAASASSNKEQPQGQGNILPKIFPLSVQLPMDTACKCGGCQCAEQNDDLSSSSAGIPHADILEIRHSTPAHQSPQQGKDETKAKNSPSVQSSLSHTSLPAPSLREGGSPLVTGVPRVLSTPPSYAWLKISEGCRHSCAFCTIPAIRGKLRSSPREAILHEASFVLAQGVKELVLVAQDVTAWGKDKDLRLEYLLEKLFMLPGLERLRLMYLYPAGLDDELLRFLQQAGKPFVPYFDMPLQHASANVLQRMGRPFAGNPRKAIDRIRRYFPEAALRTTLITGFPGETESDFNELVEFIEDIRFHHVGVFSYYAEAGTKAATMPEQVEQKVKDYRRDVIMENQEIISEEILQTYLGTIQDILVDTVHEEWPGLHVGRTWFQAPDVDGVTYISGRDVALGAVVKAEVTDTDVYDISALSVRGA